MENQTRNPDMPVLVTSEPILGSKAFTFSLESNLKIDKNCSTSYVGGCKKINALRQLELKILSIIHPSLFLKILDRFCC